MLVDSHCHLNLLDLSPFGGSVHPVVAEAREAGVNHMLCVSVDLETFPDIRGLAQEYPEVSASVGVHPNTWGGTEPTVEQLVELATTPEVVAIGETGLDYFRSEGDLEWQRERLRVHIAAAKGCGKPLIIHTRQAKKDTLRILQEEDAGEAGGVFHCFTEDWEMAKEGLDLGFYISFSGIVTFRSASALQKVASQVPADRLLIETDSPYLAPVPHRGKPNQPAYVRYVAQCIAELRKTSVADIEDLTAENFFSLFSRAEPV
ncbi:hydrolase, TatD family [Nitrosococcus halophilus Nc 4]|uniref:Hydrolase, TatD family n=1 Tax=Nitrosococcus halophilus (strain Nc4) TaxID=472759 RepID=D5BZG3_NITHN|nr:TatD family hydrolase [Nitrosococcus halophilus]ADE16177.1 hydrolase, TatD family [Nitrosococcus halophilus Nc 4]